MTKRRQELDKLVQDFRAGRIGLADFQRAYSAIFADENADAEFSTEAAEYYGQIHEKAEWTTPAPTGEERGFGWLDEKEFRLWLEAHLGQQLKS